MAIGAVAPTVNGERYDVASDRLDLVEAEVELAAATTASDVVMAMDRADDARRRGSMLDGYLRHKSHSKSTSEIPATHPAALIPVQYQTPAPRRTHDPARRPTQHPDRGIEVVAPHRTLVIHGSTLHGDVRVPGSSAEAPRVLRARGSHPESY
jgi:hypothetical protein